MLKPPRGLAVYVWSSLQREIPYRNSLQTTFRYACNRLPGAFLENASFHRSWSGRFPLNSMNSVAWQLEDLVSDGNSEFNRYRCIWEDDINFWKHAISHRADIHFQSSDLPVGKYIRRVRFDFCTEATAIPLSVYGSLMLPLVLHALRASP